MYHLLLRRALLTQPSSCPRLNHSSGCHRLRLRRQRRRRRRRRLLRRGGVGRGCRDHPCTSSRAGPGCLGRGPRQTRATAPKLNAASRGMGAPPTDASCRGAGPGGCGRRWQQLSWSSSAAPGPATLAACRPNRSSRRGRRARWQYISTASRCRAQAGPKCSDPGGRRSLQACPECLRRPGQGGCGRCGRRRPRTGPGSCGP